MSPTRIEVKDLVVRYGDAVAVNGGLIATDSFLEPKQHRLIGARLPV